MADDKGAPKSGKFGWGDIKSPKEYESKDGVPEPTGDCRPAGAVKPKR
jgi:hypothetical protein